MTATRSIVTQISPTASLLRSGSSENEVYLIGTAHISEESAREVSEMIRLVRPDKVFVELDAARAARLRREDLANQEDMSEKAMVDMMAKSGGMSGALPGMSSLPWLAWKAWKSGGGGGGSAGGDPLRAFFASLYKMLRRFGYVPGIEMIAAMKEADVVGAALEYGDRDINDTFRELRGAILNPHTLRGVLTTAPPPELEESVQDIFSGGGCEWEKFGRSVEVLKTREHSALMTEWMDRAMPEVADVMVHRRDKAMAQNLRKHCGSGKVVAVVGIAHVDGIEREWQDLEPDGSLPP